MEFEERFVYYRWLKDQSQPVCVAMTVRAALRVWPLIVAPKFWGDADEVSTAKETLALVTARWNLISGVASTYPTSEIVAAANESLSTAATAFGNIATRTAATAASYAVSAAADKGKVAYAAAISGTDEAAAAADSVTTGNATTTRAAIYADAGRSPGEMFSTPLWHDTGWPEGLSPEDLGPGLFDTDARFDFFKRWYDSMVRGAPLDWELQRRVALIPQETWEAGADAVAEAIAEIEARYEVQTVAADLIADRDSAVVQNRLGIGGNSPPEPIEVPAEVVASQTIVWAAVEEIAEEAEAETPDKARLARALEALKKGMGVCLKWLGTKLDLAVDTGIK